MDEPSTGLDPASRNNLWSVVKKAKQDRAIILTSSLSISLSLSLSPQKNKRNQLFLMLYHLDTWNCSFIGL